MLSFTLSIIPWMNTSEGYIAGRFGFNLFWRINTKQKNSHFHDKCNFVRLPGYHVVLILLPIPIPRPLSMLDTAGKVLLNVLTEKTCRSYCGFGRYLSFATRLKNGEFDRRCNSGGSVDSECMQLGSRAWSFSSPSCPPCF